MSCLFTGTAGLALDSGEGVGPVSSFSLCDRMSLGT
jgi:hypothetical protein